MVRHVLITGATGGLGRAFAWEFAARGWDLFLTDRERDPLDLLAHGIERAHGVGVRCMEADLSDETTRSDLIAGLTASCSRFGADAAPRRAS